MHLLQFYFYCFDIENKKKYQILLRKLTKEKKKQFLKIDDEINKNAVCTFKVMLMCRMQHNKFYD